MYQILQPIGRLSPSATPVFLLLLTPCHAQIPETGEDRWHVFREQPVQVEKIVEVPAQQSGMLLEVLVNENEIITAGATIASLDDQLLQVQLEAAQLEMESARQQALDDSKVKAQKLALEFAKTELANRQKIGGSVSGSELRAARLRVAQAELALIQEQHQQLLAETNWKIKNAALEAARLRLQQCQIESRVSGVVTKKIRHAGEWVEAGQPICEISCLEAVNVDLVIPMRAVKLDKILGAPVRVATQLTGGPTKRLSGSIVSYDPQVSSQGKIRIHARVSNIKHGVTWLLLHGQRVDLFLPAEIVYSEMLSKSEELPLEETTM